MTINILKSNRDLTLRVGIIAGEASGDILGAGLIHALKQLHPDIIIEGIAGPLMIAAGCKSILPIEPLSVTGIFEVLSRLPQLITTRNKILKYFRDNPPDIFIGVDAPDFNLPIERYLRARNILTVHYNSPSIWAWRQKRVHKIAKSTDLMLTLYPFEARFYEKYNIPVKFVGHPLADQINPIPKENARQLLGLAKDKRIIAVLPGSRANEIERLTEPFLLAAKWCLKQQANLEFVIPFINIEREEQFNRLHKEIAPELTIHKVKGYSHEVMAAADTILLASGTATLEGMLLSRPMVVAYRLSQLSYAIIKRLIKIPYISLPNILAGERIIPEFIQNDATPENLGKALLTQLNHDNADMLACFDRLHTTLKCNASVQAAQAILQLIVKSDKDIKG